MYHICGCIVLRMNLVYFHKGDVFMEAAILNSMIKTNFKDLE